MLAPALLDVVRAEDTNVMQQLRTALAPKPAAWGEVRVGTATRIDPDPRSPALLHAFGQLLGANPVAAPVAPLRAAADDPDTVSTGTAVAAGLIGFGLGAIIGNAMNDDDDDYCCYPNWGHSTVIVGARQLDVRVSVGMTSYTLSGGSCGSSTAPSVERAPALVECDSPLVE